MLATWLLRLFTCDGLLLVCLFAIPSIIHSALPNNRGVIEITAVVLPIVAFFSRAVAGHQHITSNSCHASFRKFQFLVLYLTILVLLLVDCFMILLHVMPKPASGKGDGLALAVVIGTYLILMGIATYPGPPKPLPEVLTF